MKNTSLWVLWKRNPVKQGIIRFKFSSFYLNKLNFDTKLKEIHAGIVFCKHFNNVHSPLDPLDLFDTKLVAISTSVDEIRRPEDTHVWVFFRNSSGLTVNISKMKKLTLGRFSMLVDPHSWIWAIVGSSHNSPWFARYDRCMTTTFQLTHLAPSLFVGRWVGLETPNLKFITLGEAV